MTRQKVRAALYNELQNFQSPKAHHYQCFSLSLTKVTKKDHVSTVQLAVNVAFEHETNLHSPRDLHEHQCNA
jgi:hypothetical protein